MAIEAVVFDFGGVLTASPFDGFARYEAERGLPKDLLRTVNATNPDDNAWARFERSEIDAETFDRLFREESAALGHPVPGSEVLTLIGGQMRPRMLAALKTCKQHFKVGCITNNLKPTADRPLRPEVAETFKLFDVLIESAKVGLRKPDPRIYLLICERLGVEPAACVYLDDLGINCKPAAQLGMKAIKVLGEEQALAELSAATGLSLGLEAVG